MKGNIRLYGRYAGISMKAQLQYKASFIMEAFAQFLMNGIEFVGLIALFDRFGSLAGWQLPEVALLYGLVNITFAFADMFSRGFDVFGTQVRSGEFDRILLRPRSTVLQLMGFEFTMRKIGRIAQGLLVFLWSALQKTIHWNIGKIFLIFFAMAGGIALFIGLFILQATMAFWTVETLEIMNSLTYGGNYAAQYPMSIYKSWFRSFLTFIVPLSTICYFPVITILEKQDILHTPLWLGWFSPLAGFLFLLVSLQVWKIGIRHYTSTGN